MRGKAVNKPGMHEERLALHSGLVTNLASI